MPADAECAGRPQGDAVPVATRSLKTPMGVLRVTASEDKLLYVELPRQTTEPPFDRWLRERLLRHPDTPPLRAALAQLRDYFAGKRRDFDLPLDPDGTEFQRRVWLAVAAIPFGKTTSYGQIALRLGDRQLARAVGAAVGANPLPIIIPCHRVLGTGGALVGYGGGLRMKIWLLRHEGALLA
jgi:methylated-DNA-[protein]-cysteine S-methyltransferase